jgi:hypothetical protein
MASREEYRAFTVKTASAAIAKGHHDPANLRELLIWTTSKTTCAMVEEYFRGHLDDKQLLEALFSIAEEGEDNGDAPWAAANTISEFPAAMLAPHKARLVTLSNHPWSYLSTPAAHALAKVQASAI